MQSSTSWANLDVHRAQVRQDSVHYISVPASCHHAETWALCHPSSRLFFFFNRNLDLNIKNSYFKMWACSSDFDPSWIARFVVSAVTPEWFSLASAILDVFFLFLFSTLTSTLQISLWQNHGESKQGHPSWQEKRVLAAGIALCSLDHWCLIQKVVTLKNRPYLELFDVFFF